MVELPDILEARRRLSAYLRHTPMVKSYTLSQLVGAQVHLKLEVFQRTGSFKARTAFNQLLRLTPEQRRQGVVAMSGGNFAQGVAYAGRTLGVPSLVVMPEFTPRNYLEATRGYGARIELAPTFLDTLHRAERHQAEGLTLVHAFDSEAGVAGNGTLALEVLEDVPQVTDVIVSVGGGGLLAGLTLALKALKPDVRVWGVETEGADSLRQALAAGHVTETEPTSLARTIAVPYVSELALRLAQEHLQGEVVISDQEAYKALVLLLERAKVLTELAASSTLSAALALRERFTPEDEVVLVLCGGNVSLADLLDYQRRWPADDHVPARQDGSGSATRAGIFIPDDYRKAA